MRKSKYIRTYAFLLHDLPMKFAALFCAQKSAWPLCNWIYADTLYADYSKGDCKFQRDFSTNFCAHAARIFITAGRER